MKNQTLPTHLPMLVADHFAIAGLPTLLTTQMSPTTRQAARPQGAASPRNSSNRFAATTEDVANAELPTTHPAASPQKGVDCHCATTDHRTMLARATPSTSPPPADHCCAIAGFPTLATYHLATVGLLVLVAGHRTTARFQMVAVDRRVVGLLTLVANHLATVGFPTLVAYRLETARMGFRTLVAVRAGRAGFLMSMGDRRPNFSASPTQHIM